MKELSVLFWIIAGTVFNVPFSIKCCVGYFPLSKTELRLSDRFEVFFTEFLLLQGYKQTQVEVTFPLPFINSRTVFLRKKHNDFMVSVMETICIRIGRKTTFMATKVIDKHSIISIGVY